MSAKLTRAVSTPPPPLPKPQGPYEWFTLVTPTLDSHGTIIRPEGVRTETHKKNPVFLWMHQASGGCFAPTPGPEAVIGRVKEYRQTSERFDILVEFDTDDEFSKACYEKVQRGFLRAVSIGFNPISWHEEILTEGEPAVCIYDEVDLMEGSLVIVPSNPDALKRTAGQTSQARAYLSRLGKRAALDYVRALGEDNPRAQLLTALSGDPGSARLVGGADGPLAALLISSLERLVVVEGELAEFKRNPMPNQGKNAVGVGEVGYHEDTTFSQVVVGPAEGKELKMKKKMDAEMRMAYRGMMSREMDMAEEHMRAMGYSEENREYHRGQSMQRMDVVEMLAKILREDLMEDPSEEGEMAARATPNCGDSATMVRFAAIAATIRPLDMRSVIKVVRAAFGSEDASIIAGNIDGLKFKSDRLDRIMQDQRLALREVEKNKREELLTDLLARQLITPATAQMARGIDPATGQPSAEGPWTLTHLERYVEHVAGSAPIAPVRVAPPQAVAANGHAMPSPVAQDIRQPPIPTREEIFRQQQKGGDGGEDRMLAGLGLNPQAVRALGIA